MYTYKLPYIVHTSNLSLFTIIFSFLVCPMIRLVFQQWKNTKKMHQALKKINTTYHYKA